MVIKQQQKALYSLQLKAYTLTQSANNSTLNYAFNNGKQVTIRSHLSHSLYSWQFAKACIWLALPQPAISYYDFTQLWNELSISVCY